MTVEEREGVEGCFIKGDASALPCPPKTWLHLGQRHWLMQPAFTTSQAPQVYVRQSQQTHQPVGSGRISACALTHRHPWRGARGAGHLDLSGLGFVERWPGHRLRAGIGLRQGAAQQMGVLVRGASQCLRGVELHLRAGSQLAAGSPGAGGRATTGVDLAAALQPDTIVLVADAGLGTVNAVLLSIAPFPEFPTVVILNRYDDSLDLHRRNLAWLQTRKGLEVVTTPEALSKRLT